MSRARVPCDDRGMTTAPPRAETSFSPAPDPDEPPVRKLYRSADGRLLGGVARGLAGHLGLPVSWVRIVFVGPVHGRRLGALLYAAFWFFVPLGVGGVGRTRHPAPADRGRTTAAAGCARKPDKGQIFALLALLVGTGDLRRQTSSSAGANGLSLAGAADRRRRRPGLAPGGQRPPRPLGGGRPPQAACCRCCAARPGCVLVGAGVTGIVVAPGLGRATSAPSSRPRSPSLVGIALLAGPYLVRMTQDLSEERLMRIRAQERAEVAAHVHDSVLHTLTLIQRNAEDPREVRPARPRPGARAARLALQAARAPARTRTRSPTTLAEAVRRDGRRGRGPPRRPHRGRGASATARSTRSWAPRCRPRARRWSTPPSTVARAARCRSSPRWRGVRSSCPYGTGAPASTWTRSPRTGWASASRSSAACERNGGTARLRVGAGRAARRSSWRWRGRRSASMTRRARGGRRPRPSTGAAGQHGDGGGAATAPAADRGGEGRRAGRARRRPPDVPYGRPGRDRPRPSGPASRSSARPPTSTRRSRSSPRPAPRSSCSTSISRAAAGSRCCAAAPR